MNFLMAKITDIHKEQGFNLVELLVVVALISILTLIAYPTYQDQMRKTRRSDAKVALTELANREEKFFSSADSPHYTGTITGTPGLGYTTGLSPERYYTLSIALGANSFVATATPVAGGPQAGDAKCATFTISSTGAKGSTPAGGSCW